MARGIRRAGRTVTRRPLYLEKRLYDEVRRKGVPEIAAQTGISAKTIYKIINVSEKPAYDQKEVPARIGTLERLCSAVNLDLLVDVLKRAQPKLVRNLSDVSIFVGAQAPKDARPRVSPEDLRAVVDVQEALRGFLAAPVSGVEPARQRETGEPRLNLVMPRSIQKLREGWKELQTQDRFAVVIGSHPVNGLFPDAYEAVESFFPANSRPPLTFVRHVSQDVGVFAGPMACVRTTKRWKEVGVLVPPGLAGRRARFFPREGSAHASYFDVAVVMATAQVCLVAGHGAAGTLGAARLVRRMWGTLEEKVREHRACILVARVAAGRDEDNCAVAFRVDDPVPITPKALTAPS